jgi:hypothetical protein
MRSGGLVATPLYSNSSGAKVSSVRADAVKRSPVKPKDQGGAQTKRPIWMSVSLNQLLDKVELNQAVPRLSLGAFLRVNY